MSFPVCEGREQRGRIRGISGAEKDTPPRPIRLADLLLPSLGGLPPGNHRKTGQSTPFFHIFGRSKASNLSKHAKHPAGTLLRANLLASAICAPAPRNCRWAAADSARHLAPRCVDWKLYIDRLEFMLDGMVHAPRPLSVFTRKYRNLQRRSRFRRMRLMVAPPVGRPRS